MIAIDFKNRSIEIKQLAGSLVFFKLKSVAFVSISVVLISLCLKKFCINLISIPFSNKWEWRKHFFRILIGYKETNKQNLISSSPNWVSNKHYKETSKQNLFSSSPNWVSSKRYKEASKQNLISSSANWVSNKRYKETSKQNLIGFN